MRQAEFETEEGRSRDDCDPRSDHRSDDRSHARIAKESPHDGGDGIAADGTDDGHMQNVGPQRKQSAVGKQEPLHHKDHRHGQAAGPRPENQPGQHAADQMARNGDDHELKVDHLAGKDHGGHHAGHRHDAVGQLVAQLINRNTHGHRGKRTGRRANVGTEISIRNVHSARPLYSALNRFAIRSLGEELSAFLSR